MCICPTSHSYDKLLRQIQSSSIDVFIATSTPFVKYGGVAHYSLVNDLYRNQSLKKILTDIQRFA